MKTKFFKFGMPLVAFMMAIAFAFATDAKTPVDDAFVMGYTIQDGVCKSVPFNCNNLESLPCTYQGQQVKRFSNGTSCSVQLFHKIK